MRRLNLLKHTMAAGWALLWLAVEPGLVGAAQRPALATALETHHISVTSVFSGRQIGLYGSAIGADQEERSLVVHVHSAPESISLAKIARKWGLWLPGQKSTLENVPRFLFIAGSKGADAALQIKYDHILAKTRHMHSGDTGNTTDTDRTLALDAFRRLQSDKNLWQIGTGEVSWQQDGLFYATIDLPGDTPLGEYSVYTSLYAQDRLLFETQDTLLLEREGFGAVLHRSARGLPYLYAIVCLLLTFMIGGAVGFFFKLR